KSPGHLLARRGDPGQRDLRAAMNTQQDLHQRGWRGHLVTVHPGDDVAGANPGKGCRRVAERAEYQRAGAHRRDPGWDAGALVVWHACGRRRVDLAQALLVGPLLAQLGARIRLGALRAVPAARDEYSDKAGSPDLEARTGTSSDDLVRD